IVYYEWKEKWWRSIATIRDYKINVGLDIKQGVVAYAMKQASLCGKLAYCCAECWLPTLQKGNYTPEWAERYLTSVSPISESNGNETSEESEEDWEEEQDENMDDIWEEEQDGDIDNDPDQSDLPSDDSSIAESDGEELIEDSDTN
ncbi:hypothetical protein BDQ17DRAFT_1247207, partial [Cyathus striatus]